jgi:nicotinamidase-related amidase
VPPPVVFRIFGFKTDSVNFAIEEFENRKGKESKGSCGIGEPLGKAKLADGSIIDAGRMLIRDQWNTELHDPLKKNFEASPSSALSDVRFHKARLSGFWSGTTSALDFLTERGFKTLLFAGVNTDQCVLASIQGVANMVFNTVLLKDGSGTTSPNYARETVLFNCRKAWGIVSSYIALSEGVATMK